MANSPAANNDSIVINDVEVALYARSQPQLWPSLGVGPVIPLPRHPEVVDKIVFMHKYGPGQLSIFA